MSAGRPAPLTASTFNLQGLSQELYRTTLATPLTRRRPAVTRLSDTAPCENSFTTWPPRPPHTVFLQPNEFTSTMLKGHVTGTCAPALWCLLPTFLASSTFSTTFIGATAKTHFLTQRFCRPIYALFLFVLFLQPNYSISFVVIFR